MIPVEITTTASINKGLVELSLEELTTPKDGYRTLLDKWWVCRNGKPLVYKISTDQLYAQCNPNKLLAKRISDIYGLPEEPIFIPVAYWKD